MEQIEGLGPNPSDQELNDELVFMRILLETMDPDAFDYEDEMAKHTHKIQQIERRLGIEEAPAGSSQTQMASQESWHSARTPRAMNGSFEDMLSPIADFNAFNGVDMAGVTAPERGPITPPPVRRSNMNEFTLDTGSRKRPANVLSSPTHDSPSAKRATPSPADSAPHTPGSEALPEATFFDLTQGSSRRQPTSQAARSASENLYQRQFQAQLQAQRALEERQARLLRDTQLANSFNLGLPADRIGSSRPSTQAVLNKDGTFRRVSSVNNANSASNGADLANSWLNPPATVKNEFASPSAGPSIKHEFGSSSTQPNGQSSFVPRDNRARSPIQIDSDSDLEEVNAADFAAAQTRRNPNRRPNRPSPAVQYPRPQQPMYGAKPMNGYAPHPAQQLAGMNTSMLQQYNQAFNALPQSSMGFMPNDPRATGVRHAMNGFSMPGAFPGAETLLSQSPYASNNAYARLHGSQYNPHVTQSRVPAHVIDLDDDESDGVGEFGYMLSDPTKTKEELDALILEAAKGELSPEQRKGTPEEFKLPLMEHQKIGLTWMRDKESSTAKGGILADDMGLGKTLQALAVIVSNQSEDRSRKTTLVVAPVALLYQWESEIKDKIKLEHRLKVHVHHGQKKKSFQQLRNFDVVLTTYGSLASELKKYEHWRTVIAGDENALPTKKEQMSLLGSECKWYRVVLDEAQCIKNKDTGAAKAAFKLDAIYRWCMTGTPMMNNVAELWSLIHFCRIRPYNDLRRFRDEIKNPLEKRHEAGRKNAMKKLQALIRAVMLRRTKNSQLDGKPIITLPPRTTDIVTREFEKDQNDFYKAVESNAQAIFNKYLKEGSVMRNYSHVLTLLLRLRQITDHPTLATVIVDDAVGVETTEQNMLALAKKLKPDVVRRLKEQDGDFMCPICIDAIGPPGPIIFFPCGHFLDNDCLSSLVMNAQANSEDLIKCPECREKFKQTNVIDYMSFKKTHAPELLTQEERGVEAEEEEQEDDDTESDFDSDDDSDAGSLKDFIVDDDEVKEEEAEEVGVDMNGDGEGGEPVPQSANSFMRNGSDGRKKKRKGKGKKKEKKKKKTLAELRKDGRRNKKTWQKYLRRLEKTWETSAKIDQTLELLDKLAVEKPKEKILIFSQFTSFLDFLEVPLRRRGVGYQRYDGSMSTKDREEAVKDFKTNPRVQIILISLKAGNAGLNLNCASQVIILDPFWNPFIEEQAIDRAHRIGQQHEVNVHRIIIPNTVEDRILALQEKKRDLINTALDENAGKSLARLGVRELAYLFGQRPDV